MQKKRNLKRYLARRFFIRFHMSIILIGTILVGLLSTKALLNANIDNVIIRYPLVVIISYLAFFLFIRLWLFYIKYRDRIINNALDLIDIPTGSFTQDSVEFGGGEFGGAGASGFFEMPGGDIISEGSS
jgi:uncharacterized membrane protein YgcG